MTDRDQSKPDDSKDLPVQPDPANAIPPPPPVGDVSLDPELQAFIGRQLQATYDEVLNQPVPDRFLELLQKLDQDKADKP